MQLDPLAFILHKLRSLAVAFLAVGVLFIILGLGIILFPIIIQYLFVIGFVILGLIFLLIAMRISHLRSVVKRFDIWKR